MTKRDDIEFAKKTVLFDAKINEYEDGVNVDVDALMDILLDRRKEILAFNVSNDKKVAALERVLDVVEAYNREANGFFIATVGEIVSVTSKKEQDKLVWLAERAGLHRRSNNLEIFRKVVFDTYQKLDSANKKSFRYLDDVKEYRRSQSKQQGDKERAYAEEKLPLVDRYLDNPSVPLDEKLRVVDKTLEIITQKAFGRVKANEMRAVYCRKAANLCVKAWPGYRDRQEYYMRKAHEYQRVADQAKLHRGDISSQDYMGKYRTDR